MGKFCCDSCKQQSQQLGFQVSCGTCAQRPCVQKESICQTCCKVSAPAPLPPPPVKPCQKKKCKKPECVGCKLRVRIIQANNFVPCCQNKRVCNSVTLFANQPCYQNKNKHCYNNCTYSSCAPCNHQTAHAEQAIYPNQNFNNFNSVQSGCNSCHGNYYNQNQLAY